MTVSLETKVNQQTITQDMYTEEESKRWSRSKGSTLKSIYTGTPCGSLTLLLDGITVRGDTADNANFCVSAAFRYDAGGQSSHAHHAGYTSDQSDDCNLHGLVP